MHQANQLSLYPVNIISQQQASQSSMYPASIVSQQLANNPQSLVMNLMMMMAT
jgi:hypothetical protein